MHAELLVVLRAHFRMGCVRVLGRTESVKRPAVPIETGAIVAPASGDRVHRPAHRVAAIQHRAGPAHHFQSVQRIDVNRAPILVRAVPVGRVVQPNAIDQHQRAEPGKPAQIGRTLTMPGLLQHDGGLLAQCFGGRPGHLMLEIRHGHLADGIGQRERILLGARCGHKHGRQLRHLVGSRFARDRRPGHRLRRGLSETRRQGNNAT